MTRRRTLAALAALALAGCSRRDHESERPPSGPIRIVLKHQPFWGDPATFRGLLARFEQRHPGVTVITEALPSASDVVHQFFLTALEGGARDFDVFIVDVVWTQELARAGWIADLSAAFPPATVRSNFLAPAAETALFQSRTYAVPWYLDVGLLYRRVDLCPNAPVTHADLMESAERALKDKRAAQGYVWQGRQYEGLVCNAYEAIWGHGGATMDGTRVLLDTPEARAGLAWLRDTLARGVSPAAVTSMAEEESRRVFQEGQCVFMRNWPYAYAESQRPGSPVRGKVAISSLPSEKGGHGSGALGGYLLALNARSPAYKREAALALITHLTSLDANVEMAVAYGRNPPRRAPYLDPRLVRAMPLTASLLPIIERAKPRPLTPYYPALSDTLQSEMSAAITGVRPPGEALRRAQALVDHLTQAPS
ncbi:Maltose/maltodextrin ABC transporter, substrate binding periplasmic protein MalE [Minicystis rosea]|nr:Maltose/maltodextrin ABC transporter, substrate binding periplasmic protein MalE [Minicystis rosea]